MVFGFLDVSFEWSEYATRLHELLWKKSKNSKELKVKESITLCEQVSFVPDMSFAFRLTLKICYENVVFSSKIIVSPWYLW